jgi:sporulation protein YlmC with PRC-barrel domain
MIRNLLATTALATLVATGAFAQDATTPAPAPADPAQTTDQAAPQMTGEGHLATQIIGESVFNGSGDDAENIGDVNDIVLGTDGNIQAVVVGVGGFLGIGEKDVAVDFAQLEWAERDGDRWLVAPMTKEQLETQAAFDRSAYEPEQPVASNDPGASTTTPPAGGVAPAPDTTAEAPAEPAPDATAEAPAEPAPDATAEAPADPAAPAPDATAEAPATTTPVPETTTQAPAEPAPADQMAQDPAPADPAAPAPDATTTGAIDKSTLKEMPATDIRAEEMVGTKVYGAGDVDVGEIGDVALTADGKIDAYIVDVGGFLGVGEKEVAIGSDNLAFMTDAQGNKYLYTNFSKEQLDAAAAYDKSTYTEKRDDQRLMMTQ